MVCEAAAPPGGSAEAPAPAPAPPYHQELRKQPACVALALISVATRKDAKRIVKVPETVVLAREREGDRWVVHACGRGGGLLELVHDIVDGLSWGGTEQRRTSRPAGWASVQKGGAVALEVGWTGPRGSANFGGALALQAEDLRDRLRALPRCEPIFLQRRVPPRAHEDYHVCVKWKRGLALVAAKRDAPTLTTDEEEDGGGAKTRKKKKKKKKKHSEKSNADGNAGEEEEEVAPPPPPEAVTQPWLLERLDDACCIMAAQLNKKPRVVVDSFQATFCVSRASELFLLWFEAVTFVKPLKPSRAAEWGFHAPMPVRPQSAKATMRRYKAPWIPSHYSKAHVDPSEVDARQAKLAKKLAAQYAGAHEGEAAAKGEPGAPAASAEDPTTMAPPEQQQEQHPHKEQEEVPRTTYKPQAAGAVERVDPLPSSARRRPQSACLPSRPASASGVRVQIRRKAARPYAHLEKYFGQLIDRPAQITELAYSHVEKRPPKAPRRPQSAASSRSRSAPRGVSATHPSSSSSSSSPKRRQQFEKRARATAVARRWTSLGAQLRAAAAKQTTWRRVLDDARASNDGDRLRHALVAQALESWCTAATSTTAHDHTQDITHMNQILTSLHLPPQALDTID